MGKKTAAKLLTVGLAATAVAGCGSGSRFRNDPRPATEIEVSAAVTGNQIVVSPKRFGAGLVNVIISNNTAASQQVTLRSPTFSQQTGPINPAVVTSFQADLSSGRYRLATSNPSIAPATIVVGPARPASQDQLLEP
ncbi:MAG TPA: hypothetical protein VHX88_03850 [Solirubrobacteraceae bacterium]|jgi:hypothetical protein|nr:hypothetical protein [Solirubrobacteraceae bacterium]